MSLFLALVSILAASVILAKSADWIVISTIRLARIFKVSDFNIGFFVLGMATSSPEIFIGLMSSVFGNPELSFANLLGASVMLMTLVVGLNAILNGEVYFPKSFRLIDITTTGIVIILPVFFILDGYLSRIDGIILLVCYSIFILFMNRRHTLIDKIRQVDSRHHYRKIILFSILGLSGLFLGSRMIVVNVESLTLQLHASLLFIGLVIMPFTTNLPELSVMLTAFKKKHNQVGIGDFLGSAVANTPILGVVSLIKPIRINPASVYLSEAVLLCSVILFIIFYAYRKKLTRIEGIILTALFFFFLFSEIFMR